MRYEFIVEDAVPGDNAVELPELCGTCYPTGGTSLFGQVRGRGGCRDPLGACVISGSRSSRCGDFRTSAERPDLPRSAAGASQRGAIQGVPEGHQ